MKTDISNLRGMHWLARLGGIRKEKQCGGSVEPDQPDIFTLSAVHMYMRFQRIQIGRTGHFSEVLLTRELCSLGAEI